MTNIRPVNLIAENAKALLLDAEILRTRRRYASATALAVLSLEESGKLAHLEGLFDLSHSGNTKVLRKHPRKLDAAARSLIWSMVNTDVTEIVKSQGYELKFVPCGTPRIDDNITLERIFSRVNVEAFEAASAAKLRDRRQYRYILMLAKGQFDEVKRQALYVDIDGNGQTKSLPSQISRETADRIIRLARRAIGTIAWERNRRAKLAARMGSSTNNRR